MQTAALHPCTDASTRARPHACTRRRSAPCRPSVDRSPRLVQHGLGASLRGTCIVATDRPRITISLAPDEYAVLRRLAGLQGRPMSRIVSELIGEFAPVLARVCDAIDLAHQAQGKVRENIRKAADEAEAAILPHAQAVLQQFEAFNDDLRQLGLELSADDGAASRGAAAARRGSPRPVITGATKPTKGKKSPKRGRGRAAA